MAVVNLPDEHSVVRHIRKPLLRRDENGNVLGVLPQAFQRRENEEYLSVTWLQHFSKDYERGLSMSAAAIGRQLTVKRGDGFAVGSVGNVKAICGTRNVKVRLLHEQHNKKNTGYASWRGLPRDDLDLLTLLADEAFVDTRPVTAIAPLPEPPAEP